MPSIYAFSVESASRPIAVIADVTPRQLQLAATILTQRRIADGHVGTDATVVWTKVDLFPIPLEFTSGMLISAADCAELPSGSAVVIEGGLNNPMINDDGHQWWVTGADRAYPAAPNPTARYRILYVGG